MQKSILKITTIVTIIMISSCLYLIPSLATNETVNNSTNNTSNTEEDEIDNKVDSHDDDVYSTQADNTNTEDGEVVQTPTVSSDSDKQISSYTTVSTLPEANLGLNNILNVILIAIGVIIILLAIAILIRLKG